MKKIIIDTNFLMIPYRFRVDIFSEFARICPFNYGIFIYETSIGELNSIIEKQSGEDKRAAKFALNLIGIKKISAIKSKNKYVDLAILENSDENTVVATQDIGLKKQLLEKGVPVIIMRQKKYLQLVEKPKGI